MSSCKDQTTFRPVKKKITIFSLAGHSPTERDVVLPQMSEADEDGAGDQDDEIDDEVEDDLETDGSDDTEGEDLESEQEVDDVEEAAWTCNCQADTLLHIA